MIGGKNEKKHFSRRHQLEKRIISEVLKGDCLVLEAKAFETDAVSKWLGET